MTWAAMASTKLLDATLWCGNPGAPAPPNCLPTTLTGGGAGGQLSVIDAWVSGDYYPADDVFIVPRGGGHGDWAGNQILGFKPGTGWLLKRNYSTAYPSISGPGPWLYKYSDGTPASVHSYDSVVWMPAKSRFWCGGGIYWSPGGESVPEVAWWLNPSDWSWTEKATRKGGYGISSGWDPIGERILYRYSNGFAAYDPDLEDGGPNTAAYTDLFVQSGSVTSSSPLAINAPARLCYRIDSANKHLCLVNLNNLQAKEVVLTCTGNLEVLAMSGPGLLYRDNRLVALGPSSVAGRFAVYTAVVDGRGLAGQPAVQWVRDPVDANEPASTGTHGVWKKFYGPYNDGKYRVFNQPNQNVYEYTPTWTSTTHTLDEVTDLLIEVLP
jgi:hypothetical protein